MKRLFANWSRKRLEEPRRLLSAFYVGSIAVLFGSIAALSIVLSWNTVVRERKRIEVSKGQLSSFLGFHQRSLSEEMWTGNYTAIGMKIAEVMRQFGSPEFSLYLSNEEGRCVYHTSDRDESSTECTVPSDLRATDSGVDLAHVPVSEISGTSSYRYILPLRVGEFAKGYLHLALKDPFQFYRGSIWSPALTIFLPNFIILFVLLLGWFVFSRRYFLLPYLKRLLSLEKGRAETELAMQVAHDIRSPLAALNMLAAKSALLSEDERALIGGAIGRISGIANRLLESNRGPVVEDSIESSAAEEEPLFLLVQDAVYEKQRQLREHVALAIDVEMGEGAETRFSKVNATEFKAILSNLIDNAVDATGRVGRVVVRLSGDRDWNRIEIVDDGCGIPEEVLPRLFARGATFGKTRGNGLGLYYAKRYTAAWGGGIELQSKAGVGTRVTLRYPAEATPTTFASNLEIFPSHAVVVIDDDVSVHDLWRARLAGLGDDVRLRCYSAPVIDESKYGEHARDVYLVDYEFNGLKSTGLDWIATLPATCRRRAFLVTNRYEDAEVRRRSRELGVRIIPKPISALIPITLRSPGPGLRLAPARADDSSSVRV